MLFEGKRRSVGAELMGAGNGGGVVIYGLNKQIMYD